MVPDDVQRVIERLQEVPLGELRPATTQYAGAPLCAVDAVFSIGVRYQSTENVVRRYCEFFNLPMWIPRTPPPSKDQQHPVKAFLNNVQSHEPADLADRIFGNRHRTSTRNGILKAEAVVNFCRVLNDYGAQYMDQARALIHDKGFDRSIREIPGQRSGTSLKYFYMLLGEESLIKPDRMILGFLNTVLQKRVTAMEAQELLTQTVDVLRDRYPLLTVRSLDHAIWKHQSGRT